MAKRWFLRMISVALSIGVFCGGFMPMMHSLPGYTAFAADRNTEVTVTSTTSGTETSGLAGVPVSASAPAAVHGSTTRTQGYARGFRSYTRRSTSRSYGYGGYGYSGSHQGYSGSRLGYGGFGSHLFSFGAGYMFGRLFHPFGSYYGYSGMYGYHHFSVLGLLFDLVILYIIWRVIRAFFRRR
ncbi:hypothetical protein [Alicyclobacillus ferrooxydans]|uniref:Uncharacterized protein n=1 Tax=Alicyclobacillus ferrooxydans TaxID=471514 RepID=A0A0P9CBX7_9BACL|nr:hypothetical protein [Alicyclobacillus ferrooxydans]KPV42960.1 hypothetical protein AN477_14885 [Alicyclobacillus ferrooxydans]